MTYEMTPSQLHAIGEDASYTGGFFIRGGSAIFYLAEEKLCYNVILTIRGKDGLQTSLKTQDDRNNSIEFSIAKRAGMYCLEGTTFKDDIAIQVVDVLKQIHLFISKRKAVKSRNKETILAAVCNVKSFRDFWDDLMTFAIGDLAGFIVVEGICNAKADADDKAETDALKPKGETMKNALNALFASEELKTAHTKDSDLTSLDHYPQMVVECIFPGIPVYEMKALLLARMLASYILREHDLLPLSNRDDLGNKVYMTFAQIAKRDLTMNAGECLLEANKLYEPAAKAKKGDNDVFRNLGANQAIRGMLRS